MLARCSRATLLDVARRAGVRHRLVVVHDARYRATLHRAMRLPHANVDEMSEHACAGELLRGRVLLKSPMYYNWVRPGVALYALAATMYPYPMSVFASGAIVGVLHLTGWRSECAEYIAARAVIKVELEFDAARRARQRRARASRA